MAQYYNIRRRTLIDLTKETIDFETWETKGFQDYSCCRHSSGFYIFLNPDEVEKNDEYKDKDPYTLRENVNSPFHQRRINYTIDLLNNFITKQSGRILDLGCGQGHFTNKIKRSFIEHEVHGMDYSFSAINYANSQFEGIEFILANAYYPPYCDEYFDVIVCNNIWEHVPDPLRLLNALSRILKTGGLLVISTPSRYRIGNLIRVFFGKKIRLISDQHVTEYTIGQVKEQLQWGGYTLKKAYSPQLKGNRKIIRLFKPIVNIWIKAVKSHHILESTVFYAAIKM